MSDEPREPLSDRGADDVPPPANAPQLPGWARQSAPSDEFSEERMQAYFGPKWEKSYRKKLAPFFEDPSFVPTWNWPAAIAFPPAWFLYRKLYVPFTVFFLVPGFVFRWLTGSDTPQNPKTPSYSTLNLKINGIFSPKRLVEIYNIKQL